MGGFMRTRKRSAVLAATCAALAVLTAPGAASAAPTGLFVGNYSTTTISQFTIGSGGLLSPNGTAATGYESWMMAATPNGKHLYGTNWGAADVSQFSIGLDGTLTPLSPATVPTGSEPEQIAVSPNGKNVYVASNTGGRVSVYDVGSGGALSLIQSVTADLKNPTAVVVSPNGASVYVGDSKAPDIVEFNRSSAGMLNPKSTATVPTVVSEYLNLVMTPNGRYVYASGAATALIAEYSVGAGGELAPQASPTAAMGEGNDQLTVSPSGKHLYASGCEADAVFQYSIGTTGELSPLTPASVPSGGFCPEEQWMTATGANLYAADFGDGGNGDVSQFRVSSTGTLTLLSPPDVPAGPGAGDVVIAPDQGPVAKFSIKAGKARKRTKFNASKSFDSDGKVVRYVWNFGDHKTKTTSSPKVSHTYNKARKYKVTLTVFDDSGCSTTQVFTGQTAYCNGTKAARVTHRVKIKKRKKH